MLQLHYLAVFVGVIIGAYVLVWHRKNLKEKVREIVKSYLQIFLGFLVGFSPFILFELRHGFTNSFNIIRFIFNSPDTGVGGQIFSNIGVVFFRLFGGIVFNYPKSADFSKFDNLVLSTWQILIIVVSLFSIVLFIKKIKDSYADTDKTNKNLLIITWLFLGIGLFALYKKPIYDYYLEFLYPLPFILIGFLCSFFLKKNILFKLLSVALIILTVHLSIAFSIFRFPPNNQLKQTRSIAEFALTQADGKPYNFALITGGNSDHAYKYFFKLAGRDPVVIENPQIDPERNSVTDQLIVICDTLPCGPLGHSLWEVAGFGRAEIEGKWTVQNLEVYKLIHRDGKVTYE